MKYARVNLDEASYQEIDLPWQYLTFKDWSPLKKIYQEYCSYKNFSSVMPLFDLQFDDVHTDIIGYWDQKTLAAFSMIKRWDHHSAECLQFAWNYHNPQLRLGIKTLEHECWLYKTRGFKYLYLGQDQDYKRLILGYQILGPCVDK